MKWWLSAAVALGLGPWSALAIEMPLDQSEANQQRCQGMYSKGDWGGPQDPFILTMFPNITNDNDDDDPIVSLLIFEWKDEPLIGIRSTPELPKELICDSDTSSRNLCDKEDIGKWILAPSAGEDSKNPIVNEAIHLKGSKPIHYSIKKTGYYCVAAYGYSAPKYKGLVEFRASYGELAATQIPKLPFYGGLAILYALLSVFWGFLYYQHRYDILPVQNYITAIMVFLVVEMLMTWGFYDFQNRHGDNIGAKVFLVFVAILNAFRNSFSFFLLLIVCMGYGVVKSSLGKTMLRVRWLAIAHFVFGLAYAITSLLVAPDSASPWLLLIVLPLAATLTAFYIWTLNSLNFTLKDLRERKQAVKEGMYKKLWWCILLSILVIFGFFFFNSFSFASATDPDYVPFHWKSRWFMLDGWLNLVYFADVAFIAYVWRPTANNRRFAMSDEIAQDENGEFEFADIGAPDDSDDDEEAQVGTKPPNAASSSNQQRSVTPQPPNVESREPTNLDNLRDSFDSEPVFAVGDGDKFSSDDDSDDDSDDSDNDDDRKKLVEKKK